jgi:predicted kinase
MRQEKIIVLVGISGSGKSTYAKQLQKEIGNAVIVNRDKLREQLFGFGETEHSEYYKRSDLKACETEVTFMQDTLIDTALSRGQIVIADNTHLEMKYLRAYKKFGVVVRYKFIQCAMQTAIDRDAERIRSVGRKVIEKQYNKFLNVKRNWDTELYVPDTQWVIDNQKYDLPPCFIYDMDGTLTIHKNGRNPYSDECLDDIIRESLALIEHRLNDQYVQYHTVICTGRNKSAESNTKRWLSTHAIFYDDFYIREEGDFRPDWVIKEEMWRKIAKKYRIIAMFDDRTQVVRLARALGFDVYQIGTGNF